MAPLPPWTCQSKTETPSAPRLAPLDGPRCASLTMADTGLGHAVATVHRPSSIYASPAKQAVQPGPEHGSEGSPPQKQGLSPQASFSSPQPSFNWSRPASFNSARRSAGFRTPPPSPIELLNLELLASDTTAAEASAPAPDSDRLQQQQALPVRSLQAQLDDVAVPAPAVTEPDVDSQRDADESQARAGLLQQLGAAFAELQTLINQRLAPPTRPPTSDSHPCLPLPPTRIPTTLTPQRHTQQPSGSRTEAAPATGVDSAAQLGLPARGPVSVTESPSIIGSGAPSVYFSLRESLAIDSGSWVLADNAAMTGVGPEAEATAIATVPAVTAPSPAPARGPAPPQWAAASPTRAGVTAARGAGPAGWQVASIASVASSVGVVAMLPSVRQHHPETSPPLAPEPAMSLVTLCHGIHSEANSPSQSMASNDRATSSRMEVSIGQHPIAALTCAPYSETDSESDTAAQSARPAAPSAAAAAVASDWEDSDDSCWQVPQASCDSQRSRSCSRGAPQDSGSGSSASHSGVLHGSCVHSCTDSADSGGRGTATEASSSARRSRSHAVAASATNSSSSSRDSGSHTSFRGCAVQTDEHTFSSHTQLSDSYAAAQPASSYVYSKDTHGSLAKAALRAAETQTDIVPSFSLHSHEAVSQPVAAGSHGQPAAPAEPQSPAAVSAAAQASGDGWPLLPVMRPNPLYHTSEGSVAGGTPDKRIGMKSFTGARTEGGTSGLLAVVGGLTRPDNTGPVVCGSVGTVCEAAQTQTVQPGGFAAEVMAQLSALAAAVAPAANAAAEAVADAAPAGAQPSRAMRLLVAALDASAPRAAAGAPVRVSTVAALSPLVAASAHLSVSPTLASLPPTTPIAQSQSLPTVASMDTPVVSAPGPQAAQYAEPPQVPPPEHTPVAAGVVTAVSSVQRGGLLGQLALSTVTGQGSLATPLLAAEAVHSVTRLGEVWGGVRSPLLAAYQGLRPSERTPAPLARTSIGAGLRSASEHTPVAGRGFTHTGLRTPTSTGSQTMDTTGTLTERTPLVGHGKEATGDEGSGSMGTGVVAAQQGGIGVSVTGAAARAASLPGAALSTPQLARCLRGPGEPLRLNIDPPKRLTPLLLNGSDRHLFSQPQ